MALLDTVLPAARFREIDEVVLALPPSEAWELMRHADLGALPIARALFAIRTLPDRVEGKATGPVHLRIDDIVSTPEQPGFSVLAEDPGHELVVGAIGKVWQLEIPFVHVRGAAAYARFAEPGWVKVAWAVRVEPHGAGHAKVGVEVRVDATDDASFERFRSYFRLIGPGSRYIRRAMLGSLARAYGEGRSRGSEVLEGIAGAGIMAAAFATPFLRRARAHWGLEEGDLDRTFPGDALVSSPRWAWTHGIPIEAPAEAVWPWVAQIGADRGGFYSYEALENLAGCALRNADVVRPSWEVHEGERLVLHPKMPPLRIVEVEPGRHFVAYGPPDEDAKKAGRPWVAVTWTFLVEPLGARRCRFISRYRCATSDDLATRVQFGEAAIEPVGFAMDRRMLLGVRDRAEEAYLRAADARDAKSAKHPP